jgi:hypothetical protein
MYFVFPHGNNNNYSKIVVNEKTVYSDSAAFLVTDGYRLGLTGGIWLSPGNSNSQHHHSGDTLLRFFFGGSFTSLGCNNNDRSTQAIELCNWFSEKMWRECLQSKKSVTLQNVELSVEQWNTLGALPLDELYHYDGGSLSPDFLRITKVHWLTICWNDVVFESLATRDAEHPLTCMHLVAFGRQSRQLQQPGDLDPLIRGLGRVKDLVFYRCNLTQTTLWDHFWRSIRDNNVLLSLEMQYEPSDLDPLVATEQLKVVHCCLTSNLFLTTIRLGPLDEEATAYWKENIQPLLKANQDHLPRVRCAETVTHSTQTTSMTRVARWETITTTSVLHTKTVRKILEPLVLFETILYVQNHPTKLYNLLREYPGAWAGAHN